MHTHPTHGARTSQIFLFSALICFSLLLPFDVLAEITVLDDAIVFAQKGPKKGEVEPFKKVVSFENRMTFTGAYPTADAAYSHALMENLKRGIIQGVKFAVPASREFAIIISYYCTQGLIGAEFPYSCYSHVFVVDSEGYLQHQLRGNFLWIIPHENLPYFALVEDFCCSDKGKAHLYNLDGQKVCEGYLGLEHRYLRGSEFTCGTNWKDGVLLDKEQIPLKKK